MRQLLHGSLKSAFTSALLILKFVVPLYLLADILLYFDLLRHLRPIFAPLTSLLALPPEAAMALAGGVLINIYAAIAFAVPLDLTAHQWTILAVFLGVCHSMPVECAIMNRLGISIVYSIALRFGGACLSVIPVLWLPEALFTGTARAADPVVPQPGSFGEMLVHSLSGAMVLSIRIILLISLIIVAMDLLRSTRLMQAHLKRVNSSFSILVGQLLGITYGAGILIGEATRGRLSREDIFFIGTFLMICHSIIEDVLLFVLFGANYWVIVTARLTAALLLSYSLGRVFRYVSLDRVMRA